MNPRNRTLSKALLPFSVAAMLYGGAAQASELFQFSLVADRDSSAGIIPVSATPFDPSSLPQGRFFGREDYSSRAVAIEIVMNAIESRHSDSLVYRRKVTGGYRISTRWRFRASSRGATLRYEIRF